MAKETGVADFSEKTYSIGDITARYRRDSQRGAIGLDLFPRAMASKIVERRATLKGEPEIDIVAGATPPRAWEIDPLVHLKLVGNPYSGAFAQGRTMRGSPSNARFKFVSQQHEITDQKHEVVTILESAEGLRLEHRLSWFDSDTAAQVETRFINGSKEPVKLEMLTSFSLGNITPFHHADAPGRLRVHRFRSVWSAEGRPETQPIEELHLERSWSGAGLFSERFGQIGSMPVRGWFPFVAVEDVEAGVTWGAQLAWPGSWQIEIFRQHDDVCISGGLADREFGQWMKTIAPGETFVAPPALISCVAGGIDELCDRLTSLHNRAVNQQPAVDQDLPIIFNEWCTTWGDPRHEKVIAIADRLRGTDVRYLVIDAGWYKNDQGDWSSAHGDWNPNREMFPQGLAATAAAIRDRGLIPGLWFEMETVGENSAAFQLTDHLLKRDGLPLTVRQRRFWDLNDPVAIDYLSEKVIDLLQQCGFGYLKVDYNETIGVGSDDPDSLGEGLRKQMLGTHRFFEKIRQRLPELVIENCASGGHRLEPSMLMRTAMSSFSDAHETREIPIIAANLHRLMLPRQSQIWAVLHRADSDRRLAYSLAATFLGRMCLSGEIDGLSVSQWELVQRAISLYRKAAPIIRNGKSRIVGESGQSWRHPTGWQAVVRSSTDQRSALVVAHAFERAPKAVTIQLPAGDSWRVDSAFPQKSATSRVEANKLKLSFDSDFSAQVLLFSR